MHLDQDELQLITMIMIFILIVIQLAGTDYLLGIHSTMTPPFKLQISELHIVHLI